MKLVRSVAAPQGCGTTLTHQHGSYCFYGVCKRAETILPSLVLLLCLAGVFCRSAAAAEIERIEVGEISAFSGNVKLEHGFSGAGDGLLVGGKVFVGDEIETGSGGMIEITFGVNSRLHLPQNSSARIMGQSVKEEVVEGIARVTTTTEVLLRRGALRCRVRENLVTPTPLVIIAANARFVLPRADFTISRDERQPEHLRRLPVFLAWGRGSINVKNSGESTWNPELAVDFSAPASATLPEMPEQNYLPKWERISPEVAAQAMEKIPFSADVRPSTPVKVKPHDPELEGA